MAKLEITTDRLTLVLQTTDEVLASIDALTPAEKANVSPRWLEQMRAAPANNPWTHGFTVRLRVGGAMIGNCAFKGPPNTDGVVEIAYGIDLSHRGQGYATEAAQALTDYALASPQVRRVCAHTLRESAASARVLTKCGFRHVGEVVDPEDGPVWRWERGRDEPST